MGTPRQARRQRKVDVAWTGKKDIKHLSQSWLNMDGGLPLCLLLYYVAPGGRMTLMLPSMLIHKIFTALDSSSPGRRSLLSAIFPALLGSH